MRPNEDMIRTHGMSWYGSLSMLKVSESSVIGFPCQAIQRLSKYNFLLQQNARNQEMIRQAEERRREAEKKRTEEEEKANEALKQQYERERQARLEQVSVTDCSKSVWHLLLFDICCGYTDCAKCVNLQEFRSQSPPIPTVQKRLGQQIPPRPPSVDSHRSATTFSVSCLN